MNKRFDVVVSSLTGLLLFCGPAATAQDADRRALGVDDYFALQYPGSPQVSPDGEWVAYTVSGQDLGNDRRWTRIWRTDTG